MTFSKIALFGKFNDASVAGALARVRDFLQGKGLTVLLGNTTSAEIEGERIDERYLASGKRIDLAIVIGGDGTLLNVARLLAEYDVPSIGINLGRLGFLTDIPMIEMESNLNAILDGDFSIEQRTMLSCDIRKDDAHKNNNLVFSGIALNDMVISKGNTGKLIEFEIRVNGQFVSHPRCDGLILSTPTGSTAYALSAGGPIIYPDLPVLCISPICPHTLSNRPIILDENTRVEISSMVINEPPANFSLDGVISYRLDGAEQISMTRAANKLKLIRIQGFNYFETLHSKLGWHG